MYKNITSYLGTKGPVPSNLMNPYKVTFIAPPQQQSCIENYKSSPHVESSPQSTHLPSTYPNTNQERLPSSNPKVWGPPLWFSLHTSSVYYPENPSPIVKERIKGRILAIPYEIPCPTCKPHASAFIEKHRDNLDKIVSSRMGLFRFYVDFHNAVNARHNKPIMSYDEAWKKYA